MSTYDSKYINDIIGDMEIVGILAVDTDNNGVFLTTTSGPDRRPRSYVTAATYAELREEIAQSSLVYTSPSPRDISTNRMHTPA